MESLIKEHYELKGTEDDAGRSKSKRPLQKKDCTVRALALAFELEYDVAYDFCMEQGRKSHRGFHLHKLLEKYAKSGALFFGKKVIKHSFPAEKGVERMNVGAFGYLHPKGKYVTRQAGHVATVIDGVLHDLNISVFSFERCVYIAYEIVDYEKPVKYVKLAGGGHEIV